MVESPVVTVQSVEGAAQSAIQYFENTRNFLEAVKDMKLLTFEASDLEKVLTFFLYTLINFCLVVFSWSRITLSQYNSVYFS